MPPKITTNSISTRNIKNNILAIPAAPAAISVNPNIAATMAINKNVAAHFNIIVSIWLHSLCYKIMPNKNELYRKINIKRSTFVFFA